jgi:transcriptional regulator with XRE-family HTH domain
MLGPLLTKLRDKHNLTNAEIAERSGLTTSTVRRILSGDTQGPSIDNVKDIVLAMDEPIETLFEIMSASYGMPTPATAPQTPEDVSSEHTEYESWLNERAVVKGILTYFKNLFHVTLFLYP